MPEASSATDATAQAGAVDTNGQNGAASTTATQNQDVNRDSSTGSENGGKPKSMLDAVQAAVDPTKAGASPAPQAGSQQDTKPAADGKADGSKDEESEDLTEDELTRLNERTQKRFRHLSSQVKELNGQIEQIKPDAEVGRQVTEFVAKAGLNTDEVNTGFGIMAAMKGDPFKALEMLEPYVAALQQMTGRVLPADLQQAVDNGQVTEAMAREIAQNRAKASFSTQALEQTRQQTAQERQQQAHKAHVDRVSGAVSAFERQWQATDPDYKLKADSVHQGVELRIRRDGFPKDEAAAVQLTKDVIKEVEARFAGLRPALKPLNPVTGGNVGSAAKPAPKSMRDVVERAAAMG